MELLPDELKTRLPPLLSQEAADEPVVYARYFLPDTEWNWYVIEGEPEDGDFLFFGFVFGIAERFRLLPSLGASVRPRPPRGDRAARS